LIKRALARLIRSIGYPGITREFYYFLSIYKTMDGDTAYFDALSTGQLLLIKSVTKELVLPFLKR